MNARKRVSIEAQIRTAYAALAPAPGAWVTLADLRRAVIAMPNDVAAVLTEMHSESVTNRTGSVILIPESNQKVLTDFDWLCSVTIGNEPRHLIAIHD